MLVVLGIAILAVVGLGIFLVTGDDDDDDGTTISDDNAATESNGGDDSDDGDDGDAPTESDDADSGDIGDPTAPVDAFLAAIADRDCSALVESVAERSLPSIQPACEAAPVYETSDVSVSTDIQSQDEDEAVVSVIGSFAWCEEDDCEEDPLEEEVTLINEDGSWKIRIWEDVDGYQVISDETSSEHGDNLDDDLLDDPTYDDDYPGYES